MRVTWNKKSSVLTTKILKPKQKIKEINTERRPFSFLSLKRHFRISYPGIFVIVKFAWNSKCLLSEIKPWQIFFLLNRARKKTHSTQGYKDERNFGGSAEERMWIIKRNKQTNIHTIYIVQWRHFWSITPFSWNTYSWCLRWNYYFLSEKGGIKTVWEGTTKHPIRTHF